MRRSGRLPKSIVEGRHEGRTIGKTRAGVSKRVVPSAVVRARGTPPIVRLFFAFCVLPLLGVFPFLAAVNNPNENVRTYMTIAMVEQHTLRLDQVIQTFGWTNDMALVPAKPAPYHVSVKGPATSFAGVIPYAVFSKFAPSFGMPYPKPGTPKEEAAAYLRAATWVCRIFAVQIPCLLFLIWLERYLRDFSKDTSLRLSAVAAAGLGTNYLAYNHMFASHSLFAIAAFVAFALIERSIRRSHGDPRQTSPRTALLAGWFTGWSVLLEYHALPLALILSLYALVAFRRPTRLLAFGAGGLFHVGLMMLFQWQAYGNPLTPGHRMVESGLKQFHQTTLFGADVPDLAHIRALWFDTGFGFFGTSPFMYLGLLALPFAFFFPLGPSRRRRQWRLSTIVWFVGLFLLSVGVSGFGNWRGGWTVGPRFLGAAPPFVALGALVVMERLAHNSKQRRSIARGVAGGLALASVISIGVVGLLYDSFPEEAERPLTQIVLPLIRGGFVPHHIGEWFGWTTYKFWYAALAGLLGAPILAALFADIERTYELWIMRFGCAGLALFVGLMPAFSAPPSGNPAPAPAGVRGYMGIWEPKGRDRISVMRADAERYGPKRPCMWYQLADLERKMSLVEEADADERRARAPRADTCTRKMF